MIQIKENTGKLFVIVQRNIYHIFSLKLGGKREFRCQFFQRGKIWTTQGIFQISLKIRYLKII